MNFYKHYIGDYQRDTGHLTMIEHGAYRQMLDSHYATGKPLPENRDILYRLLRAMSKIEKEAVDTVLQQFWVDTNKGWINGRSLEEIEKAELQAETNRRITREREARRKGHKPTNEALDEALDDFPENRTTGGEPNHNHNHNHNHNQKPDTKKHIAAAERLIHFLNEKTEKQTKLRNPKGELTVGAKTIINILKKGYLEDQCRMVIARQYREWHGDPKMQKCIRVSTLFRLSKFEEYLAACV